MAAAGRCWWPWPPAPHVRPWTGSHACVCGLCLGCPPQSNDPRFMNEERLLEAEANAELTVGHVRGFLYNMVGLATLFDGCGYVTVTAYRGRRTAYGQPARSGTARMTSKCLCVAPGGPRSKRRGAVWCASTSAVVISPWTQFQTSSTLTCR